MSNHVETILIIGIGMIGASIGLAAKQKGLKVYGYDLCESNIKVALDEKIIHEGLESLDQISEELISNDIDLIIISVPPKQTLDVLNILCDVWNTEITITETCSVKNHIQLDNVSNIILSHPIAGSDKSGPSAADANLFLNGAQLANNIVQVSHLNRISGMFSGQLVGYASLYSNIYGYSLSTVETNGEWNRAYIGVVANTRHIIESAPNDKLLVGIAMILDCLLYTSDAADE